MKTWRVHIKHFANMSPWLKEAFARVSAAHANTELPTVKMPDESPRIFEWVHNWIYAVSFSGLRSAPIPIINDAGTHGLEVRPEEEEKSDSEESVVITGVRVKVEDESKPLSAAPVTAAAPATGNATETKPPSNSDDVQELRANPITPRDLMDLYLLALKLEIFSLRNAAIDSLHVWFHPDAQEKRKQRGNRAGAAAATEPADIEDYEPSKQLPHRRVPWMTDVRHVFARTPEDNPLRRFLISTAVIFLFSKRPEGRELPEEWKEVLTGTGEIGYCMLKFIAGCKWVAGKDVNKLIIWPKYAFHEAGTNISVD